MSQCWIQLFLTLCCFLFYFVVVQGQGTGQGLPPDPGLGPGPDLGLGPGLGPEQIYKFRQVLDDDGNYELFWNFVGETIQFEVKVRALGYVGFGLSRDRSGKMSPADMVIGWVENDNVYFGDYHTVGAGSHVPVMDTVQDWTLRSRPGLLMAKEENGYTMLTFERKLETCDDQDFPITGDTMMVLYSYSNSDPNVTAESFPPHGTNRGSKYIFFENQPKVPDIFPPPATYRLPLQISNHNIPAKLYSRQCLVFDVRESLLPNSYFIMYEPIIQPGSEPYVYRMVLTRCNIRDPVLVNNRFDCSEGGPSPVKACTNIIATWAMGAKRFYFPESMGIFQGPDDPFIFVLQIHYTNGRRVTGIQDSSGLNIMFTTTPRPIHAAFLNLGSVISTNLRQVIPPGEKKFKTSTFCSQRCMQWGFETVSRTIQAIGVVYHGNDIAREMKLRHFRNNVELPWIDHDKHYDSFFQSIRLFQQPVTIENNTDIISLDCTYDSSERKTLTKGGWSQLEELCRATLLYTPPLPMDQCLSWSSLDRLVTATNQTIPENMTMSYLDYVDKWDTGAKTRLNEAMRLSRQKALCSSQKQTPNYALDRFENPHIQDIMEYQEPPSPCPQTPNIGAVMGTLP